MVVDVARRKWKLSDAEAFGLTLKLFAAAGAAALVVGGVLLPEGFVGPLSARVRGLFIKHTKTGNPLVDSVAEHQATPTTVYWYFHVTILLGRRRHPHRDRPRRRQGLPPRLLCGLGVLLVEMIRLVLIMSLATAALAGTFVGGLIDFTAAYDASTWAAAASGRQAPMSWAASHGRASGTS